MPIPRLHDARQIASQQPDGHRSCSSAWVHGQWHMVLRLSIIRGITIRHLHVQTAQRVGALAALGRMGLPASNFGFPPIFWKCREISLKFTRLLKKGLLGGHFWLRPGRNCISKISNNPTISKSETVWPFEILEKKKTNWPFGKEGFQIGELN